MLYSIIPPILVVLSLVGIIIFLVKKAPQVSRLDLEEASDGSSRIDLRETGFLGKSVQKIKNTNWRSGQNAALTVVEKIMKSLRFVFLKLGVIFSRGWVRVKNHREAEKAEYLNSEPEKILTEDEKIVEKIRNYIPEKKIFVRKSIEKSKTEEVKIEPIISREATRPRVEIKDRLEELLMERIAANPRDIEAYERLGQYYMEIESYEFAKECFKQIVKLNPADRNAKFTLKKLERLLSS